MGVCDALTCYLNQVCSGHIPGVGAKPESQRWTQDTVKKEKVFEISGCFFFHFLPC